MKKRRIQSQQKKSWKSRQSLFFRSKQDLRILQKQSKSLKEGKRSELLRWIFAHVKWSRLRQNNTFQDCRRRCRLIKTEIFYAWIEETESVYLSQKSQKVSDPLAITEEVNFVHRLKAKIWISVPVNELHFGRRHFLTQCHVEFGIVYDRNRT